MDFTLLALGIAAAGYFVGEGLKNFQNPRAIDSMESIFGNDEHELIKHSDVHHFMGVSKKDAEMLLRDYPNVPHIKLNGEVYYPKQRLREWLMKLGD
ncbi:DNA-binding protein [Lentibacillus juripiscarius]|uniref:DNA-binding protein n=1 Tax=Lentibacillus juripiscarius TaxID=257446 RepID=A0ABW5V4Q3_9BACI